MLSRGPDLFIIAADGQKLAAGAPGHSLDPQRPLVGAVGGQQTAIQRIQQNFVLQQCKHKNSITSRLGLETFTYLTNSSKWFNLIMGNIV